MIIIITFVSNHSEKVLGLSPGQEVSVWSLHVLPVAPCSSHIPRNIQSWAKLIGHSKLPVGVSVSVDGYLSDELATCPG